jgi:sec-independent protein translocase protein TatA
MVGDILQPTHLLFVLVVALLVLGPKRLPEVGRTLGNGIRDFRSAINGESPERRESRDEIESQPWHSEPEDKHEFAHEGETTPQSHEFAHEADGVSAGPAQAAPVAPVAAAPAPTQPAPPAPAPAASAPVEPTAVEPARVEPAVAQSVPAPSQPAATSDTAGAPNKHEFAYESSEAGEDPARPRS